MRGLKQRLIDCVAECAHERPRETAIVGLGASGTSVWSWERLWRESGRIATKLLQLGVRPGEHVAYQLPNRAEFVAITLGALRIGAICCPLMPFFRERELAFALARSGARVLFLLDSFGGRRPSEEVAALAPRLPHLEHVIAIDRLDETLDDIAADGRAIDSCPPPPPGAFAQLLFTSGTSGTPKGVLHRQDTLMRAVQSLFTE